MSLAGELKRRLQMLLHRRRFQRDLEDEIRLHVDLRTRQNIAAGLDPAVARHIAARRFGNPTRIRERSFTEYGWTWLETLFQDIAYGVRGLLRSPAVTGVALVSLALGIGANTVIFSFLDALLLRSLPVKDPQQLVKLGDNDVEGITDEFASIDLYSYPFYRQFQQKNQVFSDTAAILSMVNGVHGFVDNAGESEFLHVQLVSGTYFQTLGVPASIGRVLNDSDDSTEGNHPVLVISQGFWKRRFAGDPRILDHKLTLGKTTFTIVGVAPPEFFGTIVGVAPDAWAPLSMMASIPPGWGNYKDNFNSALYILGRLKPGVSIAQATADVNVLFPRIERGFPDAKLTQQNLSNLEHAHVTVKSISEGISNLRRTYSKPLQVLMVIVALVLLIACANIANLLLARSTARARELAVRQALGARRMRLVRQFLTESLLLALAGGTLGIGLAAVAGRLLLRMISPGPDTIALDVSLNFRLLAFAFAVTLTTALLFGTLPALRATGLNLQQNLRNGRGSSPAAGRSRLAKALVVSQVAVSLLLSVAAFLFLRTLINLGRVDLGFNRQNVLRLYVDADSIGYKGDDPRFRVLFQQIEDRVSALPGVQAASFSAFTFNEGSWNSGVLVPGTSRDPKLFVRHNITGNDFLKVMQIPLLAGRAFGPQDTATSERVAIISQSTARRLFPTGSPIGRVYTIGSADDTPVEEHVIGVAGDVKLGSVAAPTRLVDYLPYTQQEWGFGGFEVRYTGTFGAISSEVQHAIHAVSPNLPIANVTTLDAQIADSYSNQTLVAELSAFFGFVAVFLSCVGLYGLMSYLVSRRTVEIGIRMALGADRTEVARRILREIAVWLLGGIALGLPAAFFGIRLVRSLLYGLTPTDTVSLLAAVLLLLFAGLGAGFLPARRASRLNPTTALRSE